MLHADYCAEYEYSPKILLSRGKIFVALYAVLIHTEKKTQFKFRCALQYTRSNITNDFNKLLLTYLNVGVIKYFVS